MSTSSDTPGRNRDDLEPTPPAPLSQARPLYWSVRRELWENRSIYLAPLVVTLFVLFASSIATLTLPSRLEAADPAARESLVLEHYSRPPAPVMFVTVLVGFFYSLSALYGERRDRSILFWKSQPVSDRTTVLAKASIPLVVLPLIGLVLGWFTHIVVVSLTAVILAASGFSTSLVRADLAIFQSPFVMIYGVTVFTLWFAPIYGWLFLISAWAKRVPLLWAVLPWVVIAAVESVAFGTSAFCGLLQYRFAGAMTEAFETMDVALIRLSHLEPGRFLTSFGLWSGLVVTAVFLAAAIRLRRAREPI